MNSPDLHKANTRRSQATLLIGVAVALVIPAYLAAMIVSGPQMQYGDYFPMIESMVSPNGVFSPRGLFVHSNENLSAIPKLVYLANITLFDGSNISLGIVVLLFSAITAIVLGIAVRPLCGSTISLQLVIAWSLIVLLFPIGAAVNYLFPMGGTQWLLASLFAICAVLAAVRNKGIVAGVLGGLATFSYGTGLAVWPALMLVLVSRRRLGWKDIVMLGLGIVSVAIERLTASGMQATTLEANPFAILRSIAVTAGGALSNNVDTAVIFGSVIVVGASFVLFLEVKQGGTDNVKLSLIGITAFGLASFLLIGIARTDLGDANQLASRYENLSSLVVLSLVLIALGSVRRPQPWLYGVPIILVVALTAAVPVVKETQDRARFDQRLGAIATILNLSDGVVFGHGPNTAKTLESLGHYPFNREGRTLGCGMFGKEIPESRIRKRSESPGNIDDAKMLPNPAAALVTGWLWVTDPVECILLVNSKTRRVIGAGVIGWSREDARLAIGGSDADIGWQAIGSAKAGEKISVLFRTEADQEWSSLGEVVVLADVFSPS